MPKGIPKELYNKGWFKKGQTSPRKGIPVSTETRLKMREKKLGRKIVFSESHQHNQSIV